MDENVYRYCPRCATPLVEKSVYNAVRATCPQCDFILFLEPKVVAVVVIRRGESVLLGRRNMEPARGMWSFVSGYVDRGEKVEEAAEREVKEETNLDVTLDRLLGVLSERGNPHIVIAYCASITNGDISGLRAQPDEVSELAFFPLDMLPELAFSSDRQILHLLQRGV